MFWCTCLIHLTEVCKCVNTNLNELLVRHVATVKCLLVVHKAWKFSLLNFLATQHQHSGGKQSLKIKITEITEARRVDSILIWYSARQTHRV